MTTPVKMCVHYKEVQHSGARMYLVDCFEVFCVDGVITDPHEAAFRFMRRMLDRPYNRWPVSIERLQ